MAVGGIDPKTGLTTYSPDPVPPELARSMDFFRDLFPKGLPSSSENMENISRAQYNVAAANNLNSEASIRERAFPLDQQIKLAELKSHDLADQTTQLALDKAHLEFDRMNAMQATALDQIRLTPIALKELGAIAQGANTDTEVVPKALAWQAKYPWLANDQTAKDLMVTAGSGVQGQDFKARVTKIAPYVQQLGLPGTAYTPAGRQDLAKAVLGSNIESLTDDLTAAAPYQGTFKEPPIQDEHGQPLASDAPPISKARMIIRHVQDEFNAFPGSPSIFDSDTGDFTPAAKKAIDQMMDPYRNATQVGTLARSASSANDIAKNYGYEAKLDNSGKIQFLPVKPSATAEQLQARGVTLASENTNLVNEMNGYIKSGESPVKSPRIKLIQQQLDDNRTEAALVRKALLDKMNIKIPEAPVRPVVPSVSADTYRQGFSAKPTPTPATLPPYYTPEK